MVPWEECGERPTQRRCWVGGTLTGRRRLSSSGGGGAAPSPRCHTLRRPLPSSFRLHSSAAVSTWDSPLSSVATRWVCPESSAAVFTAAALPYEYYGAPVPAAASPSCGPTAGGTVVYVSGAELGGGSAPLT